MVGYAQPLSAELSTAKGEFSPILEMGDSQAELLHEAPSSAIRSSDFRRGRSVSDCPPLPPTPTAKKSAFYSKYGSILNGACPFLRIA